MSLEFTISESVEVSEPKMITLTKSRIESIYTDQVNKKALVEVGFGVIQEDLFVIKKREFWSLKGTAYEQSLAIAPSGDTIGEVIDNMLLNLLTMIQGNSELKSQLIESGDLVVTSSSLFSLIK